MGRALTPAELDELLPAFALDALDGDEREQVEEWVGRSPAAAAELASLRETAALLAHAGGEAPAGVWSRIEDALAAEPPRLEPPAMVVPLRAVPRRGIALRIGAGIAAASVAAAAITAVVLSDRRSAGDQQLAEMARSLERDGMRRAALAAAAAPDARTLHLESTGEPSAMVVLMPDGEGYFVAGDLPRLDEGRTYQLWAYVGDPDDPDMVSAGMLGRAVDVEAFHGPPDALGFAVTEEDATGAMEPSGDPMLVGRYA